MANITTPGSDLPDILANFGIGKDSSLSTIDGGFNKNWIVSSKVGKFILKRRPREAAGRTITECELSLFLIRSFPAAEPIKTLKGSYVYKSGKYVYSLFRFIEGMRYKDTIANLKIVAKSMAILHKRTLLYAGKTALKTNALVWCQALLKNYTGPKKKNFREIIDNCIRNLSGAGENLSKTIIHWDIHAGNLLIRDKIVNLML